MCSSDLDSPPLRAERMRHLCTQSRTTNGASLKSSTSEQTAVCWFTVRGRPRFRMAFMSASAVIGWDARWDELMTRDSPRIAPCACKSATLPPVFDIFSRSPRTHTKDLGDTGDRAFALLIFRVFSWTFLAARRPGAAVGAGVGGELAAFQALCTCLFAFAFFL